MAKSKNNVSAIKQYDPCKGRPYNRYNIYYILERERFLQSFPGYQYEQLTPQTSTSRTEDNTILTGYENLGALPPLPPRYANLELSHDWYMPGKRKLLKRDHKKTHGLASLQEIARVVADGWRNIDPPSLAYCTDLAKILKSRHRELKSMGGIKFLNTKNSSEVSKRLPKKKAPSNLHNPKRKSCLTTRPATEPCVASTPTVVSMPQVVNAPLSSPTACVSPIIEQRSRFSNQDLVVAQDVVQTSPYRSSPIPSNMVDIHEQAVMAVCGNGAMSRRYSDTTTHSEVDIPDRDIMAMWYGWP